MSLKYFIWDIFGDDKVSKNAWVVTELDLIEPADPKDLTRGRKIPRWHKDNRALYPKTCEGFRTDNVFAHCVFLHSPRLKRIIQMGTRDEVAYYPILIDRKDERKRVKGYSAMVVLNPVDAIDWNETPHEMVDGENQVTDEDNVILDRAKIGSRKLFQLMGDNNAIVVRGDLVDEMRRARINGLGFTEVRISGQVPDAIDDEIPEQPDPLLPTVARHVAAQSNIPLAGPPASNTDLFEMRVDDVLSCLGETKPKTYARKISDAKRLDAETLGRVLIEAIRRGDWSRVALPMLVGGQVVDLFGAAHIAEDLWDDALGILETASQHCKMVPGPGFLRIYQELARGLKQMAEQDPRPEQLQDRARRFSESNGWNWTRHWFGPKQGFERFEYMSDFDALLNDWLSGAPAPKAQAAPVAPAPVAAPAPAAAPEPARAVAPAPIAAFSPDEDEQPPQPPPATRRRTPARAKAPAPEPVAAPMAAPVAAPLAEVFETQPVLFPVDGHPVKTALPLTLKKKKGEDQRASKFGGLPYLAAGEEWPICGSCDQPLAFVFQLLKSDAPNVEFPPKTDLLVVYSCVNGNCPVHSGVETDPSLWRYYKTKKTEKLVEDAPSSVVLLPANELVLKETVEDNYDPGHSATLSKRDRKKTLGDFGENYRSVKVGGYPTYWREPVTITNEAGKPYEFLFQITPEGTRAGASSSFANQCELFGNRIELWFYDPDWTNGEKSLARIVQMA